MAAYRLLLGGLVRAVRVKHTVVVGQTTKTKLKEASYAQNQKHYFILLQYIKFKSLEGYVNYVNEPECRD